MPDIQITDAKGTVKQYRGLIRAFAAANPFTYGIILLVIGFLVGALAF